MLGFYLTGHPIDQYTEELKHYVNGLTLHKLKHTENNKKILVVGVITSVKIKTTKNKNRIAIVMLDDNTSRLEVVIFSKLLNLHEHILKLNNIIYKCNFL